MFDFTLSEVDTLYIMGDSRMAERPLLKIPDLVAEKRQFEESIIGQPGAVDAFAGLAARIRSGIRPRRSAPIGISFLAGPSGVGKTEIVNRLAGVMSGGELNDSEARSKVIVINGGEYQEEHTISRILGSPPGYSGSEDPREPGSGAKLVLSQENLDAHKIEYTDRNGKKQSVVLLLVDEAEKANAALHRAFLSVLDKGQLMLANNKKVAFNNVMIFYTSNVGNEAVERFRASQEDEHSLDVDTQAKDMMREAFKLAFPPEFRGRIEDLILFDPLRPQELEKIATLKLHEVEEDFWANGIDVHLEMSPEAMGMLIERGYNPSEGARALNKVIKKDIVDQLSLVDKKELNRSSIRIDVSEETGEFVFYGGIDEGRSFRERAKRQPRLPRTVPVSAEPRRTEDQDYEEPTDQIVQPLVLPWQKEASRTSETIADRQSDPLRTALRQDVDEYSKKLSQMVATGEITAEQAGEDPRIKEIAWNRIIQARANQSGMLILAYGQKTEVDLEIEKLTKAGIGTYTEWSELLREQVRVEAERQSQAHIKWWRETGQYQQTGGDGLGSRIKGAVKKVLRRDDY